jgi:type VI secretion system VasD/TssJ family lipoprotein
VAIGLTGCGLTQSVTDGTKSAFTSVFYKKIKILHLDFTAREALNTDARENNSLSESVVVRIYQLKDRKTFDKTVYQQLLKDGDTVLKADLLASRDVVVKPGATQVLICRWKLMLSSWRWWGCSVIRIWRITPGNWSLSEKSWIRISLAFWKPVITIWYYSRLRTSDVSGTQYAFAV